jgi:hypothetical protein
MNARTAFGRMNRFGTFVHLLRALRTIAATGAAAAVGVTRVLYGMTKKEAERPALAPGDVAPDFTLAASDGQTYRLADMLGAGRVIVVAWFPKAFTGG